MKKMKSLDGKYEIEKRENQLILLFNTAEKIHFFVNDNLVYVGDNFSMNTNGVNATLITKESYDKLYEKMDGSLTEEEMNDLLSDCFSSGKEIKLPQKYLTTMFD